MYFRILVALVLVLTLAMVSGQYYYGSDVHDNIDLPDYNGPDNYYYARPPMPFMRGPVFYPMRRRIYW